MHSWPRLTALVLLLALTGCAGEAETPRTGRASSSPADPEQILSDAVAVILEEPVTRFRSTVTVEHVELMRTEGFADVETGWRATSTLDVPGNGGVPRVMLARSAEGSVWMQMTDWKGDDAGCWLRVRPGYAPLGVSALTADEPQFFGILSGLEEPRLVGSDPDVLTARMGTLHVGVLLTVKFQEALGLMADGVDAPVDVTVTVDDGRLRRLTVEGADLLRALEEAGNAPDGRMRDVLAELRIELELTAAGDAEISAPPERLRTRLGDSPHGCR